MESDRNILIVVNEDAFFLSHRKEIGMEALRHGWKVTVVARDTGESGKIKSLGINFINLPINPTGRNLLQELRLMRFLCGVYRRNPDAIVHHVGLKLMLWGGVAATIAPVRGIINAVSGLGTLFAGEKPSKLTKFMFPVLRVCYGKKKNIHFIFQNKDDETVFRNHKLLGNSPVTLIKGSGADLDHFSFENLPEGEPVRIVYTGRMLREKGILEMAEAAEMMRLEYEGKVQFILCGGLSGNPSALTEDEMTKLADGKYVVWEKRRDDVKGLLKESSVFCFPSHREGFPKSVIEASAVGRPIVTCDTPGCRDTVEEGINGFKVKVKSASDLKARLVQLVEDPELRKKMGRESRRMAEENYDVGKVVSLHLDIYEELYSRKTPANKQS